MWLKYGTVVVKSGPSESHAFSDSILEFLFAVYFPILVKFGLRDLQIMLLAIFECRANRRR